MRFPSFLVLASLTASLLSGCSSSGDEHAAPTPLPEVSAVPAQPLPAWFESISPTGEAGGGAQIRIRFRKDVIPLDALESPERQAALEHFRIDPAIPGRFLFLTPRMVGFESDAPVPTSSRLRITVTSGLSDLAGDVLAGDFAWSFTTPVVALTYLTGASADAANLTPVDLHPRVELTSNVELDTDSLAAKAKLVPATGTGTPVELSVVPKPSPSPGRPGRRRFAEGDEFSDRPNYVLEPRGDLAPDTLYRFVVAAGVMPAHGNLPSAADEEGKLKTRGPFKFTGVSTMEKLGFNASSRFASGNPVLRFSNPVDEKSLKGAISLSPAPNASVPLDSAAVPDAGVRFNDFALQPRTHYTVTISDSLVDTFGQRLGAPQTVTFDTGDLTSDLWASSGYNVFPAGAPVQLNVETTNLAATNQSFRKLEPHDLIARDPSSYEDIKFLVAEKTVPQKAPSARNVTVTTPVDLRGKLGAPYGALAYDIWAPIPGRDEPASALGVVQLTNVGIFAQWFPSGGFVRLAHLSDGTPIGSAQIEVWESTTEAADHHVPSRPCASGRSDANGTWTLDSATFAACASISTDPQAPPQLVVFAHDGPDWASVRTSTWQYSPGAFFGWSAGQPDAHGTIFTDRNLYQPGESAQIVGVAYFDIDGVVQRSKATKFNVTLRSPSGKTQALGARTLDPFGAFTLNIPFGKDAETGIYSVLADAGAGQKLDGLLRVAQFKPPNFKVELSLDREFAAPDSNVSATSTSTYLFGAPVEGGTQHVYVTRSQAYFVPNGREAFQFGRVWDYPEEPPTVDSDVLQKDVTLSAGGTNTLTVPVESDLPYAMQYEVDAETTDASNLSVTDSKTFTALPSEALIGLKSDFVAEAGAPFKVEAIVTDPHGAALEGKHVKLSLQRLEYSAVTEVVEGSEAPRESVRYIDAGSAEFDSGAQSTSVSLTAPKPGEYRVRANFGDAAGESTATDLHIWITGPGEADWGLADPNTLSVKLDKKTYRPGEIATALIQSPYPEADLFFAVVRHGVFYQKTEHVKGPAPEVRFTVTPDMLPNAAVEAVLVRRGPSLARGVPAALGRLALNGVQSFKVALDAKYVKVSVKPRAARVDPGGSQRLSLHLADAAGKPVAGEVLVAVVNDAILQLTGYRFPDLVPIVYAEQPISTRFADNRADVRLVTEKKFVDKGFGFGGGEMAGLGSTRTRTNFKALAFWSGAVPTDAAGNATVDFALPDDLTTWRVMAVALTKDARFGNGETSFIATKALVTNPILPQFARPGDRFSLGVALTDVAKSGGTAGISATLAGPLDFASGGQRASAQDPISALNSAVRFDVVATGSGTTLLNIRTNLGSNSDAFSVPLPQIDTDVTETVATSGASTAATLSLPLDVPAYAQSSLGGLDLTLANTLLGEVREPQQVLLADSYPFPEDLASRIAIAADSIVLGQHFGHHADDAKLRASLNADLAALAIFGAPDGSWAPWPGNYDSAGGNIWTAGFVARQLAQAQRAGANVSDAYAHVRPFLEARLADPSPSCPSDTDLCLAQVRLAALTGLAAIGSPRNQFVADIWAKRDKLGYGERVQLARLLLKLPQWHAQGLTLRDKLLEQVYETARMGTMSDPLAGDRPVVVQSQLLALAVESALPAERVDKVLTSLLGMRRNGTWGCVCDDAEALDAITIYADKTGTPGTFSVDVKAGAAHNTASFAGYARSLKALSFPLGAGGLPAGKSSLDMTKNGSGTLHYTAALRYPAPDAGPGVYSGIRIDRLVHPANSATTLATFGLPQVAPDATHLPVSTVFEIEDRIITDHPLENAIVIDPLPAGLEAVDTAFKTSPKYFQALGDNWQIDYQQIYRDRVLAFAHYLAPGVYSVHYLVRSVTPGTFAWPGAQVSLQYAPEDFGRTSATRLTIDAPH